MFSVMKGIRKVIKADKVLKAVSVIIIACMPVTGFSWVNYVQPYPYYSPSYPPPYYYHQYFLGNPNQPRYYYYGPNTYYPYYYHPYNNYFNPYAQGY